MTTNTENLFRSRDDQELFAGDFISKIVVPHPALNFPKKITLTYQVYRGWLTRGLSSWGIGKVILSDSFGESYSLCDRFNLESGIPHSLTLKQGDCHEEELLLIAEQALLEAAAAKLDATRNTTEIYATLNVTADVMALGKHIPLERNETESVKTAAATSTETVATTTINAAWKPMLTVDTNITRPAASKSDDEMDEKDLNIGERMPKNVKTDKRSFGEDDLMNSMPIRDDSSGVDEPLGDEEDVMVDESNESKFVTVQLFQYRLGDVFEKAEKYARFTLFPMLSEQISNIFNFDSMEKDAAASTDSPIVIKSKPKNLRKYDIEQEIDMRSLQSMGVKVEPIKPIEKLYNNYEMKKEENEQRRAGEKIRVELPTYRPPEKEKVFIPIERNP